MTGLVYLQFLIFKITLKLIRFSNLIPKKLLGEVMICNQLITVIIETNLSLDFELKP